MRYFISLCVNRSHKYFQNEILNLLQAAFKLTEVPQYCFFSSLLSITDFALFNIITNTPFVTAVMQKHFRSAQNK